MAGWLKMRSAGKITVQIKYLAHNFTNKPWHAEFAAIQPVAPRLIDFSIARFYLIARTCWYTRNSPPYASLSAVGVATDDDWRHYAGGARHVDK